METDVSAVLGCSYLQMKIIFKWHLAIIVGASV